MPPEILGDDPALSPGATPDATPPAASSSGPDANLPASSSGSDTSTSQTEPKSMADAISAAFDAATNPEFKDTDPDALVQPKSAEDPAKSAEEGAAEGAPDPAKAEDGDKSTEPGKEPGAEPAKEDAEPTKEELAAMSPKARLRIQQLLEQRKGLRQQVQALETDATGYRTIRQFMDRNQLADQEMAEGMIAMADLKSGDPTRLKAFVDRIMPRLQFALEAIGQVVPADLRSRVDAGEMTEEAAKEFAQTRHKATLAQVQAERAQQTVQTVQTTQVQQAVHKAVTDWQVQTRASDPDFDLKAEAMAHVARSIVAQRGPAKNATEAVAYAQQAYAEATRILRAARPAPSATRPTPGAGIASPNRAGVQPAPTSLRDAIGAAFDQAIRRT